jgi:hypothetical protein
MGHAVPMVLAMTGIEKTFFTGTHAESYRISIETGIFPDGAKDD